MVEAPPQTDHWLISHDSLMQPCLSQSETQKPSTHACIWYIHIQNAFSVKRYWNKVFKRIKIGMYAVNINGCQRPVSVCVCVSEVSNEIVHLLWSEVKRISVCSGQRVEEGDGSDGRGHKHMHSPSLVSCWSWEMISLFRLLDRRYFSTSYGSGREAMRRYFLL